MVAVPFVMLISIVALIMFFNALTSLMVLSFLSSIDSEKKINVYFPLSIFIASLRRR